MLPSPEPHWPSTTYWKIRANPSEERERERERDFVVISIDYRNEIVRSPILEPMLL